MKSDYRGIIIRFFHGNLNLKFGFVINCIVSIIRGCGRNKVLHDYHQTHMSLPSYLLSPIQILVM